MRVKRCYGKILIVACLITFISIGLVGLAELTAGELDPTSPPGPTMKTLDEIPPSWSQRLDSTNGSTSQLFLGCDSSRFECIMHEGSPFPLPQAVLDKETGLVWERSPSSNNQFSWQVAYYDCLFKAVGGRSGWRLPTAEELFSLMDNTTTDRLPEGHPFTNIQNKQYWSSTTAPDFPGEAITALFGGSGSMGRVLKTDSDKLAWCVRGGKGNDGY